VYSIQKIKRLKVAKLKIKAFVRHAMHRWFLVQDGDGYLEVEHPGVGTVSDLGDRMGVSHLSVEGNDGAWSPRPLLVSYE
jgi:hypothetical protein